MNDKEFLKLAIRQSELSVERGLFPSGALVVFKNEIIASETSYVYPGYQHAEYKAIDNAFQKIGRLAGAILYVSMEPCLMCLGMAYWAGIRKIVYAIRKESVKQEYYEGIQDNEKTAESFNESMEYLQIPELEEDALKVVRAGEGR